MNPAQQLDRKSRNSALTKLRFRILSTIFNGLLDCKAKQEFEEALALYDRDTPDRWYNIATCVGGKSAAEVRRHYELLVTEIMQIENGQVPLPNYKAAENNNRGYGNERRAKLITITFDTNILKAMQLMSEHHIRHVPVIDGKVVGMISVADIVKAVVDQQTGESKLITVTSDTNILKAMQLMSEHHIRHVPVIDGKVVGMISVADIVKAVVDQQTGEVKQLNQFIRGDYY
ncbi:Protein RADIALIS-like 2 [Capsicum baccatum]|uniref:Protein RADIALIS-like 2 n=1 Tax=Capsicum baccatum TaxID=33114 RepID=A0A2G2V5V7_CAPBA|nr:Protein RADIALIS-like 2 [Capsicum baccatum]